MEEANNIVKGILDALKKKEYKYSNSTTCECAYDDARHGMYAYTEHEIIVGKYKFSILENNYGGEESEFDDWSMPDEIVDLEDSSLMESLEERLYESIEPTYWESYWEGISEEMEVEEEDEYDEYDDEEDEDIDNEDEEDND